MSVNMVNMAEDGSQKGTGNRPKRRPLILIALAPILTAVGWFAMAFLYPTHSKLPSLTAKPKTKREVEQSANPILREVTYCASSIEPLDITYINASGGVEETTGTDRQHRLILANPHYYRDLLPGKTREDRFHQYAVLLQCSWHYTFQASPGMRVSCMLTKRA